MRTIGRKWPKKAPRGDFQAMCDYCGVHWRRSQMRRDRAGLLVCPDEGSGKDAVTLAEGNAALSRKDRNHSRWDDGANYDTNSAPSANRTTAEDIES